MPVTREPQCFLCGKIYWGALTEGIIIRGHYICKDCEEQIIKLSPRDRYYYHVVERLKEIIWKCV